MVDQADRYRQLALLGRDAFLDSAAPAALVRRRASDETGDSEKFPRLSDEDTMAAAARKPQRPPSGIEVYPLVKKPGASFADMITIGRTPNNDIVLRDVTVSRLHAFFRKRDARWVIADAGSKNGTKVSGQVLEPRKETEVASGTTMRIGEVEVTFYSAADLFGVLLTQQ